MTDTSKTTKRNSDGRTYVNTKIAIAKTKSTKDFPEFTEKTSVYKLLTDLIEINVKGFRGIVVTALVGMHLSDDYDPLNNFYKCNPRSIFEEGIWYALKENGIPCGKSDPLNVAKNISQLDENWAKGRRPQSAATAVVKYLQMVTTEDDIKKRLILIDYFFFRLLKYAQKIKAHPLIKVDVTEQSKLEIGNNVIKFTLEYPESGQLPQFLVSILLQAIFKESNVSVVGGEESVFGTNTTSKKPADIWLEEQGIPTNLYEITVKKVSKKRLDDSVDALERTGHLDCSVTFICRLPEDVTELDLLDNHIIYSGKHFEFIDYHSFCLSLFALLSKNEVEDILLKTSELVKDVNISMPTKMGWDKIFAPKT